MRLKELISEVAPPGAKAERMVKHIKAGYAKDGKLTDKEKSIAYATAWKHHNKTNESTCSTCHKDPCVCKKSTVKEFATAGATSAGSIASVPNPNIARSKKKVKSVNALDSKGVSIFGGPAIKR